MFAAHYLVNDQPVDGAPVFKHGGTTTADAEYESQLRLAIEASFQDQWEFQDKRGSQDQLDFQDNGDSEGVQQAPWGLARAK